MTTTRTRTNLGFRIPGLGWRITLGALRMIPLVLLLVGLPAALLTYLSTNGVALPISILTVTIFGVVISALSTGPGPSRSRTARTDRSRWPRPRSPSCTS